MLWKALPPIAIPAQRLKAAAPLLIAMALHRLKMVALRSLCMKHRFELLETFGNIVARLVPTSNMLPGFAILALTRRRAPVLPTTHLMFLLTNGAALPGPKTRKPKLGPLTIDRLLAELTRPAIETSPPRRSGKPNETPYIEELELCLTQKKLTARLAQLPQAFPLPKALLDRCPLKQEKGIQQMALLCLPTH